MKLSVLKAIHNELEQCRTKIEQKAESYMVSVLAAEGTSYDLLDDSAKIDYGPDVNPNIKGNVSIDKVGKISQQEIVVMPAGPSDSKTAPVILHSILSKFAVVEPDARLSDIVTYGSVTLISGLAELMSRLWRKIVPEELGMGDVVLLRTAPKLVIYPPQVGGRAGITIRFVLYFGYRRKVKEQPVESAPIPSLLSPAAKDPVSQ